MQRSKNRDGWVPFDEEELQTQNPPSRASFEKAGQEAAVAYAQEEIERLREEIDEVAHALETAGTRERKPYILPVALGCAALIGVTFLLTGLRNRAGLPEL